MANPDIVFMRWGTHPPPRTALDTTKMRHELRATNVGHVTLDGIHYGRWDYHLPSGWKWV